MRRTTDDVFSEQKEENGTWDSFKESNPEKISRSERKYDNWHKIIKVVMMLLVSSVVLVTGVVSKATTFFIVSQVMTMTRYFDLNHQIIPRLQQVRGQCLCVMSH